MANSITIDELQVSAATILQGLSRGGPSIFIEDQGSPLGVLLSPEEYEQLRQQRGERAIAALDRLHAMIEASGATEEELLELERALDPKAP